MSKSEFRARVEQAVNGKQNGVSPWFSAWMSGQLNRDMLGEFARQHFHFISNFPRWCASVYANSDNEDIRAHVMENLMEEEGYVAGEKFPKARHADLFLDFAEHCGMSRDAVKNADADGALFGSTLALKAWGRQQGQADDYIGVASLFVGMESQVPKIFKIMMNSLLEKYGFSKKEVVFYQVHIVADEEHGEVGFKLLEKYANTPEKQAAALKAIEETDRVRRTYFDGLYYGIVAPRLAQAAE